MHSKDIAVGYAIGYNDGLGQGGGSAVVDDWQIPDYWPDIGVPADNELRLLIIKMSPDTTKFGFFTVENFTDNASAVSSGNEVMVDWGDGTSQTITMDGTGVFHEYNGGGIVMSNGVQAYIVSIKLVTSGYYYCTDSSSQYKSIAVHIGQNVKLNNLAFNNALVFYAKFFGWHPEEVNADISHQSMFGVQIRRLDMTIPWEIVPSNMFQGKQLRSFDGSNLKKIKQYAFTGNGQISKIYAPNLISIGDYAFQQCSSLKKITTAENCEIGTNAFAYCYLIDDPDLNFLSGI